MFSSVLAAPGLKLAEKFGFFSELLLLYFIPLLYQKRKGFISVVHCHFVPVGNNLLLNVVWYLYTADLLNTVDYNERSYMINQLSILCMCCW